MAETVLVERIQSVHDAKTGRIVGRFTKDVDLLEGIKEVCIKHDVRAGQFQCMGSLLHATYVQLEQSDAGELRYSPRIVSDTAVELLSGTGFIGINQQEELDVHFHGLFVDCHQGISGGHFISGENPVAVTIEFILFPLKDVVMQRGNDFTYGLPVFQFSKKE